MSIGRGVRKVNETIFQEGRTLIITEENDDKLDWSKIPDGTLKVHPKTGEMFVKVEGESDWIPAGVNQKDGTIQILKDSKIIQEVFVIKSADDGNGYFTYVNKHGDERSKPIMIENGIEYQVFELEHSPNASYIMGRNRIEAIIDDTLIYSSASGGLIEIDNKRVGVIKEEEGTEIVIKYTLYDRAGSAYPRIYVDDNEPDTSILVPGDLWLDTSESIE